MRAWEPLEGELRGGAKAWHAFCTFRDLGPERTLRKAAAVFYGCPDGEPKPHQYDQMKRWSAKHDWQERARSLDARDEMVRRLALEDYMRKQAEDHAAREARIQERLLKIREQAAEQSLQMLQYPLTEQYILREDDEDKKVTYVLRPSRWSKATAVQLAHLASNAQTGAGSPIDGEEAEYDFSTLTEEELLTFLSIDEKIRTHGKKVPESQSCDKHGLATGYGHKSPYLSQKTEIMNVT